MARDLNVKIFVHGYFGFGNIGDEAILSVLIEEFKTILSKAEFMVLSSNPQRTMRIHGVKAIRERLTSLGFWKHFFRSHILVFAGGGRYGHATWKRIALLALLAKLLGKVVIFRGVGAYPYEWRGRPIISEKPIAFKGLTGLLIRLALSRASYISVRDKYSYIVLRLTGVGRPITIEEDLAFRLKLPDPRACKELTIKYNIHGGRVLGVNLRTLDAVTNGKVVNYVAKLIQEFMEKGFNKVVFIPFGFGSFKDRFFDNDLIIASKLKRMIPNIIIINEELNPKEILCLFNYLDYVIAMRHHAIIFALLAKKPIVALVYDTKTSELLRTLSRNGVNIAFVLINNLT
jgi:polysaccharide pyruvyl transferase WcaK-like protein